MSKLFSSEHVSPGHPDKVADQISDAIVDAHYNLAPGINTRVACETLVKNNKVVLAGEITSTAQVNNEEIVSSVLEDIGYIKEKCPIFNDFEVEVYEEISVQSPDIAMGVDNKLGAGDQGIMFGGAIREAPDFTGWAHYISRMLSFLIYNERYYWARPDLKTQVTIDYGTEIPTLHTVLVSISHSNEKDIVAIRPIIVDLVHEIIHTYSIAENWKLNIPKNFQVLVNPTGSFSIYGPVSDCGLTGRKIVCDQYGGYFPVGGGAFSGKDCTKVDRSAAYRARQIACQVLAKNLADKCEVEIAYAIGVVEPVSIVVNTFGTEKVPLPEIDDFVKTFDCTLPGIIKDFKLDRTVAERGWSYQGLAKWGHIGKSFEGISIPWECYE